MKVLKYNIVILLFVFAYTSLFGQDQSTPKDGNLFIDYEFPFYPSEFDLFDEGYVLQHANIILDKNRLLLGDQYTPQINVPDKSKGSDIAWFGDNSYVVLTGNSSRYPHGILGDAIESTGFAVYIDNVLVHKYELPDRSVFETLRPLIADIIPENPGVEIILTSSNREFGARVEVYSLQAELLGVSQAIGRGFRWLHVIGAAPMRGTEKNYLAIVKTPHINGILELLYWNGEMLEAEVSFPNVSTHAIGSSNLNMALLMNIDTAKDIEIILPSFDHQKLLFLKVHEDAIVIEKQFDLPGRISTNILFDHNDPSIWLGISNKKLMKIYE